MKITKNQRNYCLQLKKEEKEKIRKEESLFLLFLSFSLSLFYLYTPIRQAKQIVKHPKIIKNK
jgi:hypothetical protein